MKEDIGRVLVPTTKLESAKPLQLGLIDHRLYPRYAEVKVGFQSTTQKYPMCKIKLHLKVSNRKKIRKLPGNGKSKTRKELLTVLFRLILEIIT